MGVSIWQLLIILPLVLLPTIIALVKDHPQKTGIILVNILGGLVFGLGWLVALVWCFIVPQKNKTRVSNASELEKLNQLKEKGVLSQEEFDEQKKALLNA